MAMYRPHRMRPRGGPGNPTEVHFWQESLRNCTNAAGESGIPQLGVGGTGCRRQLKPGREGTKAGTPAGVRGSAPGRSRQAPQGPAGLVQDAVAAIQVPAFNEALEPGAISPQPVQCQRHGSCRLLANMLGSPSVVMTSLNYPDTRASCGSQAGQLGAWRGRNLLHHRVPPRRRPRDLHL